MLRGRWVGCGEAVVVEMAAGRPGSGDRGDDVIWGDGGGSDGGVGGGDGDRGGGGGGVRSPLQSTT